MGTKETLTGIGLNEKEADAYLSLLELGEGTCATIAEKAGLKRPTTYLVLRELAKRGFVLEFKRGKKTYFTAQDPKKFVSDAELRLNNLRELVPILRTLYKKENKPRITIYEGKEKIQKIYDDVFITKGEILFISPLSLAYSAFPGIFNLADYATYSENFRFRELMDDSPKSREYKKRVERPFRTVKFMPKELNQFESEIAIFGDRVIINSIKDEYFSIGIESPHLARAFRSIYEVLWKNAID